MRTNLFVALCAFATYTLIDGALIPKLTPTSSWKGGGCFTMSIRNTYPTTIKEWGFNLVCSSSPTIEDIWGGVFDGVKDKTVTIRNSPNGVAITPNWSIVGIGFCLNYPSGDDGALVTIVPIEIVNGQNTNSIPQEFTTFLTTRKASTTTTTTTKTTTTTTTTITKISSVQQNMNQMSNTPFISQLVSTSWDGIGITTNTGSWFGGFCNTIRINNPHKQYTATSFNLKIQLSSATVKVTKLTITDSWNIENIKDTDPLDNIVNLQKTSVSIPPRRNLVGFGFCLSFLPDLKPEQFGYKIDVTLYGSYWTQPPLQEYPPITPGGLNSVYLPHGYFVSYKTDDFIRSQVQEMRKLHVRYQFANLGSINYMGIIPDKQYSRLRRWVQVSRAEDPSQLVVAQINGHQSQVWDTTLHVNIARSCKTIIDTTGADGVHLDLEPPRSDPEMIHLLKVLRETIGDEPYVSVAGSGALISWSQDHIIEVAKYADSLSPMLYDNNKAIFTIKDYQDWVKEAIMNYNIVYETPNLRKGVEVLPILPAYNANEWHDPSIENLKTALPPLFDALNNGARVKGIGIWWWWEMTNEDKQIMKTQFVDQFGSSS